MKDTRQELRYYVPLCMGFIMMAVSLALPPIGIIPTSVLYGSGMFLCLCAAVVGLDVPEILKQVNELKRINLEKLKSEMKNNEEV